MQLLCFSLLMLITLSSTGQGYMQFTHVIALEQSSSQWLSVNLEKSIPDILIQEDCPPHFQEKFESVAPIAWKLGKPLNNAEEKALTNLLLREDCSRFLHLKALSDIYFPQIDSLLHEKNLPAQYKYLPVCLSALNREFTHNTDRAGIWQLSYLEACRYGLRIDKFNDERYMPEFEFQAAINKLSDLHHRFQEPELVIYAWLKGVPETQKLLDSGKKPETDAEINHLYNYFNLLSRSFSVFELTDFSASYQLFLSDYVKIYNPVQANKSAYFELLQMDVKTFNQSNPWYIDAYINGSDRTYLLLHKDKAERYNSVKDSLQHWDEIMRIREAEEAARLLQEQLSKKKEITYTVKKGDALGLIADKHGVSISDLKNWNSLRKDMIYIGQKLVIFSESGNHKTESDAQEETKSESVIYTVKSGDTLWTIAQKYPGVSADDIMEWNEIDEDIRPGQKLKIYKN